MTITYKKQAEKYLSKVDVNTRRKIQKAIEGLLNLEGDIIKVKGMNLYRLKIEHYRIAFEIDEEGEVIIILIVLPRGDFYKKLKELDK